MFEREIQIYLLAGRGSSWYPRDHGFEVDQSSDFSLPCIRFTFILSYTPLHLFRNAQVKTPAGVT